MDVPIPENDAERVVVLKSYEVLDTEANDERKIEHRRRKEGRDGRAAS